MRKDTIFLIEPGFASPAKPGKHYFCPSCNEVEGVLASNPELAKKIDVVRVPFARPRRPVAELLGEENQGLPVLVLAKEAAGARGVREHGGRRFIPETRDILEFLADRYGVPYPHD